VDLEALTKQLGADRAGFVAKLAKAAESLEALKKANDAKQREVDELQTSTQNQIQGLRQQIADLRDEVTKVTAEKDKSEKAAMKVESDLKTELSTKDQEVVKLKRRKFEVEYPIGPDGEVLAAASGKGLVVINRGKKDHMIPGLTFNVYTFGKNARRIDLGVIKVLDVDSHTSTAKVEKLLSPMQPIVQGAKFESITYNPEEVMHFRLIGRFRKYGRSDAEKRLSELGAMVDTAVTIDTDFLVLGAPEQEEENLRDSEDYKLAVELGIKVITEEHLAQFLMY
jgi:NAD-dependent DNA ligase